MREKNAGASGGVRVTDGKEISDIESPTAGISALSLDGEDKIPTPLSFPTVNLSRWELQDMSFTDSVFLGPSSPPSSHLHFAMGSSSSLDTQDHFAPAETPNLHDLSRPGTPPLPPLDALVSLLSVPLRQLRNAL